MRRDAKYNNWNKNSLEAANSRIQEAEEQKSNMEDRLEEIMDVEQKWDKYWKELNEFLLLHSGNESV